MGTAKLDWTAEEEEKDQGQTLSGRQGEARVTQSLGSSSHS